ncbi:MAG: hypothetical protein AAB966_01810 [Patescibacteria group bacterium]
MSEPQTPDENLLFEHLDEAFVEERKRFEEARENESNKKLLDRAVAIVREATKGKKDNVHTEEAGTITPAGVTEEGEITRDTLTIGVADIQYGDLIKSGETAVVVDTDWFPFQERYIDGKKIKMEVKFAETRFTKVGAEGTDSRLGDVAIIAKATDDDVTAERLIGGLGPSSKDPDKYLMDYSFGNPIKYGSIDYKIIENIVSSVENRLGMIPPPTEELPPQA